MSKIKKLIGAAVVAFILAATAAGMVLSRRGKNASRSCERSGAVLLGL